MKQFGYPTYPPAYPHHNHLLILEEVKASHPSHPVSWLNHEIWARCKQLRLKRPVTPEINWMFKHLGYRRIRHYGRWHWVKP